MVRARQGDVYQPGVLAAVQELTEAGWKLPYATRADSLTNHRHARATADDIVQAELVPGPAAALGEAELGAIREVVRAEPLLRGALVAEDERATGVNVMLRLPGEHSREVTEAVEAARATAAAVSARHPEIEVIASGMAFMNDAFMQASMRDMQVMIPLMLAVMLAAMALILRSAWAMLPVALVIVFSSAVTMAVAGWLGYPLTPPTIAAPMIVLTVAVADGVHIVLSAMDHLRAGLSRREAAARAVSMNLEAVTYTCLTTVVGFVCLNYSDAPPVRHLANMTSVGVTVALLLSVTLLPALLAILPLRPSAQPKERGRGVMARIGAVATGWPKTIVATFAALTVLSGLAASRLEANDQFVQYFDESLPFRRDVEATMKHLSGIYRVEFQVDASGPDAITEPGYLAKLDEFGGWLRTQPEVQHVYSIADILKSVNRAVHDGRPEDYRIPPTREASSQLLLLYEMSLPTGLDLGDRVTIDKSAARLTATVRDVSSQQMIAFTGRAETWLREHAPPHMHAEATGPVVIFSAMSDRNARSMLQGDFLSLALISLCMVLVLKSLRLGLASVLPNLIPIVFGYGIWQVAVGQVNIVATVAGTVSLGIIVDDTIHFLTKYQYTRKHQGLDAVTAVRHTLEDIGPALWSTSAVLVAGFAVLILSAFQMTSHLGWLTVIVVALAPIADLFLMPALVVLVAGRGAAIPASAPPEDWLDPHGLEATQH
ncbi:MAG: MMPL family transporter [Polyangiaceae bacterium]